MTTKPEAQPKVRVPAETAPAPEEDRQRDDRETPDATNDEGSVAPKLPTSNDQGPRRSGAV